MVRMEDWRRGWCRIRETLKEAEVISLVRSGDGLDGVVAVRIVRSWMRD